MRIVLDIDVPDHQASTVAQLLDEMVGLYARKVDLYVGASGGDVVPMRKPFEAPTRSVEEPAQPAAALPPESRRRHTCGHCGELGHNARGCRKRQYMHR